MVKIKNKKNITPRAMDCLEIRELMSGKNSNLAIYHNTMRANVKHVEVVHDKADEFVYILKGTAGGTINSKKIKLKEGDFLFMPAGTRHKFETDGNDVEVISVFHAGFGSGSIDSRLAKT